MKGRTFAPTKNKVIPPNPKLTLTNGPSSVRRTSSVALAMSGDVALFNPPLNGDEDFLVQTGNYS